MKSPHSLAQSVTAKLSQLARSQKKPFDKVLTLFLLERVVSRLVSDPDLARCLVFKGGYVSVRIYDSPRFTTDVDAVLHGMEQSQAREKIKIQMEKESPDAVWFRYEKESVLTTQSDYGGWRLSYRAGLGNPPKKINRSQIVDIDIGTGDPVTPAPRQIVTTSILGDNSLSWLVYPVETIVAEKLHALITKGAANSRTRDVFDINLLLPKTDSKALKKALQATFQYRNDKLPNNVADTIESIDSSLLERGWESAAGYISGAGAFKPTLASIIRQLRELGF